MRDSSLRCLAASGNLDLLILATARALDEGRPPRGRDDGPRLGSLRRRALARGEESTPSLFDPDPAPRPAPRPEVEVEEAAEFLQSHSGLLFDLCLRAWMSEEAVEAELLAVAAEVGLAGDEAAEDYSRPQVRTLRAACKRVDCEIHRLSGFARFSPRGDGVYSAALEPDHNVIAALLPHFARRFGSQDFALVDLRRGIGFETRGGEARGLSGDEAFAALPDRGDEEAILLWRRYFQAIENADRRNERLQRRLMPRRYWKHLPETAS